MTSHGRFERLLGKRRTIIGNHLWAGYSGICVRVEQFGASPGLVIDLDNGCSATVFSTRELVDDWGVVSR